MTTTHSKQKQLWEKEHKKPFILPQMDKQDASIGVKRFLFWLREKNPSKNLTCIEMGCGKGRNSIWLAQHGIEMTGFDFSKNAIIEAKKRARELDIENNINFKIHDATKQWPFKSDCFDFAVDCFASTDIETHKGRVFARNEFRRVLKKGGLLLVYTLSTDDEFHKEMLRNYPANERNSFVHPTTGKFEKVFDLQELIEFYKDFKLVENQRIEKDTEFFNKKYHCKHFWLVLQKI